MVRLKPYRVRLSALHSTASRTGQSQPPWWRWWSWWRRWWRWWCSPEQEYKGDDERFFSASFKVFTKPTQTVSLFEKLEKRESEINLKNNLYAKPSWSFRVVSNGFGIWYMVRCEGNMERRCEGNMVRSCEGNILRGCEGIMLRDCLIIALKYSWPEVLKMIFFDSMKCWQLCLLERARWFQACSTFDTLSTRKWSRYSVNGCNCSRRLLLLSKTVWTVFWLVVHYGWVHWESDIREEVDSACESLMWLSLCHTGSLERENDVTKGQIGQNGLNNIEAWPLSLPGFCNMNCHGWSCFKYLQSNQT